MPFVLRQVTPVRLSRRPSSSASTGVCCDDGGDDDARQVVTNRTLSACLRQLASLVSLAGDIFGQCQAEAQALNERTQQLRKRLDTVQSAVDALDSRTVEIRKFFFSFLFLSLGSAAASSCWNSIVFGPLRRPLSPIQNTVEISRFDCSLFSERSTKSQSVATLASPKTFSRCFSSSGSRHDI